MAHEGLVRVVAYLEPVLAERLAEAARSDDRSLSKEIGRRLEMSFGPAGRAVLGAPGPPAVQSRVPPSESELPRVPPEPPVERGRVTEAVAAKKVAVAKAVAATGVVPASEVEKQPKVCPRAHYHRPGRYCTTCDKSF